MRQFLLGLSVSIVFMLGCAVGTMQARTAIADEPAPSGVKRWEIRCFGTPEMNHESLDIRVEKRSQAWELGLQKLGAAGWEPVSFISGQDLEVYGVCMKRPLP
ncbi:hypothetical protein [Polyangium sp. y55x31]|uniref:hypothetical protein n=1 Tax=Polyangium sp. y55x31 TaxID=3042688 RepID=UPI0024824450|nr:hypothetical protein [Polyangium sp. y55x31]MDI1484805.1 hypothetical protein [Polyangium sp. y55x31]